MDSGYCNLTDYKCANRGMILPIINEYTWSVPFRATVYFVALMSCFLGVVIVADIFMCAIEKITSKTRVIKVADNDTNENDHKVVEVKIWNESVANLTLLAVGSSAPEVLLSCIQILGNNFRAGELGPSTIVGSAAFNLLVVIAACVLAIPSPDVRRIRAFKVFLITAFFSVFAYIWLVVILTWSSPNVIEVWEAVITFLLFPVLVLIAYVADSGACRDKKVADSSINIAFETGSTTALQMKPTEELDRRSQQKKPVEEEIIRQTIQKIYSLKPDLSEMDILTLTKRMIVEGLPHSRMWYRINATRFLTGTDKLMPSMTKVLEDLYESALSGKKDTWAHVKADKSTPIIQRKKAVVQFMASRCSVHENDGTVRIGIKRSGNLDVRAVVRVKTIGGTAEAHADFRPLAKTLVFEKRETVQFIDIDIIDDDEWEEDAMFHVKVYLDDSDSQTVAIGPQNTEEITIIDNDGPGTFQFLKSSLLLKESKSMAIIPIERIQGAAGIANVSWATRDMTAKSGETYCGDEGVLTFSPGETIKNLEIAVYNGESANANKSFEVTIAKISPEGAKIGKIKTTIVTIVSDDDIKAMLSRIMNLAKTNPDSLAVESATWGMQIHNALSVNGANLSTATTTDYIMHILTFGWKVIFCLIPPLSIWGGWLTFAVAFIMIGLLATIIGDLASIFGCLVGLKDSVTAITLVALGTSMPDLIASKQLAFREKTADNSIGYVLGRNSVYVFLGIGLPWVIAAIYWDTKGETFRVEAGTLGFSVAVYSVAAVAYIGILLVRRFTCGMAELGGSKGSKIITCGILVVLWFAFVTLTSLHAYGHISYDRGDALS